MELSVVIPAYKEAENLKKLLPELERVLLECCQDNFEIIVVDCNPSLDDTEVVVTQFPHSKYLIRQGGNAYGDAIRTGFFHADKEFVAVMDGDGSHRPEDLVNMLKLAGDYDIVIGSRYISGGKTENPAILIFLSYLVNFCYRLLLGVTVKDISNSFRIYRKSQLKEITLVSNNFELVEEILIKLLLRPPVKKLLETPVHFGRRLYGESKRNLLLFACTYFLSIFHLLKLKRMFACDKRSNIKG